MPQTMELRLKIESMRNYLQYLLSQKENLLDPEVVSLSKELDKKLNEYYRLPSVKTRLG